MVPKLAKKEVSETMGYRYVGLTQPPKEFLRWGIEYKSTALIHYERYMTAIQEHRNFHIELTGLHVHPTFVQVQMELQRVTATHLY